MPAEAAQTSEIPYHPAPSLGHELGIMFGFMAIFVISMGLYLVLWKRKFAVWFLWTASVGTRFEGMKRGPLG